MMLKDFRWDILFRVEAVDRSSSLKKVRLVGLDGDRLIGKEGSRNIQTRLYIRVLLLGVGEWAKRVNSSFVRYVRGVNVRCTFVGSRRVVSSRGR